MSIPVGEQLATSWFTQARFGLFVHFGLYSLAARHEWVMTRERTATSEYEKYATYFEADRFDAAAIARAAKDAGMKYAVLTTKHHEGFCLFNTSLTTYNAYALTGRDLVAEWTEALRAEGLKVGFYYSQIDWHHPDFTVDFHHPRRDDDDAASLNDGRDWGAYRAYLHAQVRELMTNYGRVDYLFFDFTYDEFRDGWQGKGPADWGADELMAMCRELQPGIVINDRLGIPGDVVTPEQYQPSEPMRVDGELVTWEACQTLNGSWGYDRDNLDFKSADLLVRMLVDTVSKGGNLLLNIGPDGRGAIAPRDSETLAAIGEWMQTHSRAVIGAGPATFTPPPGCLYTRRGDRLYLHLLAWPFGHVHCPELADAVTYAQLLNDGSEVQIVRLDPDKPALTTEMGGQPAGTLTLTLPVQRPDVAVPVIELFLKPGA